VALSATVAVHVLLLLALLLLAPQIAADKTAGHALTSFDVAPVPPPEPVTPPAPPPKPSVEPPGGRAPAAAVSGTGEPGADSGNGGVGSGTGRGEGAGDGDEAVRYAGAEWITRPTQFQINPFWPVRAKEQRISGEVLLACIVPRPGRPDRCWMLSEMPAGHGFGAAAVRMSRIFRIRPVRRNGEPLDLPVRIPIVFQVRRR